MSFSSSNAWCHCVLHLVAQPEFKQIGDFSLIYDSHKQWWEVIQSPLLTRGVGVTWGCCFPEEGKKKYKKLDATT